MFRFRFTFEFGRKPVEVYEEPPQIVESSGDNERVVVHGFTVDDPWEDE